MTDLQGFSQPVRAALYLRRLQGEPDDSLSAQLKLLQMHARETGREVVAAYFDSPQNTDRFHRMTMDAISWVSPFNEIFLSDYGRVPVSVEELQGWKRALEGCGITVVSVRESRDHFPN